MNSADKVAKQIPKEYYENYYGKGVALTSDNAIWDSDKFMQSLGYLKKTMLSFLDLGAGTGAIVKKMKPYVFVADGYEVNEYALEHSEVPLIRRDITEPFLRNYDIVYSNAFMYLYDDDLERFFENNRDKFKVLVMVYPFNGNGDKFRVSLKDRQYFLDLFDRHGLVGIQIDEGRYDVIRKEFANDLHL